ncbi:MAG TPA: redoxin domain-containing protein [Leptolinea sp.]
MKLSIGQVAPDFTLKSHLDKEITLSSLRGKTVLLASFPMAWTPVCTGQIPSYQELLPKFESANIQVLGLSIDHVPCLKAWAESLGGITYPLLSDFWPHGAVAREYGILRENGTTERAIFIIDPKGVIQYIDIHDIDERPDIDVIFTELARIQNNPSLLPHKTTAADLNNLPKSGVVMYCTSWCPDCKKARVWLKERNITWTEVNVTEIPGASDQLNKWTEGKMITPTFDIGGEIVVDFDVDRLSQVLHVSG